VTLHVKQYTAPPAPPSTATEPATHIDIEQVASGLSSTHEARCLDNAWREHSDWLFGSVRGRSWFAKLAEIEDDFLKKGWEEGTEEVVVSYVESVGNGWTATQVWGFQVVDGVRRYCRNIVVAKGSERVEMRLVYDYSE
jgi:hypothetical protein